MQTEKAYIEILGALGTGKTSLARVFQEKAGFSLAIESEEALARLPFVKPYLSNPTKYGLQGALNFFAFHFNNLSETIYTAPENASIVSEWSPVSQYAYGHDILLPCELEAIAQLVECSQKKLPSCDLIIHIDLPLDEHLKRINQRGRETETNIPLSFVQSIRTNIEKALTKFAGNTPVLKLDSSKLDWINSDVDKQEVIRCVEKTLGRKIGLKGPR